MDAPLTARQITPEQTHDLRRRVLRPDDRSMVWPGDDDPVMYHAGAFRGEQLVAIGSIRPEARPVDAPGGVAPAPDHAAGTAWRLRGMATDPDARRIGAGRAALTALVGHAAANGCTLVWCNARIGAVAFYESAGWVRLGEEFDMPRIGPHYVMERPLAQ